MLHITGDIISDPLNAVLHCSSSNNFYRSNNNDDDDDNNNNSGRNSSCMKWMAVSGVHRGAAGGALLQRMNHNADMQHDDCMTIVSVASTSATDTWHIICATPRQRESLYTGFVSSLGLRDSPSNWSVAAQLLSPSVVLSHEHVVALSQFAAELELGRSIVKHRQPLLKVAQRTNKRRNGVQRNLWLHRNAQRLCFGSRKQQTTTRRRQVACCCCCCYCCCCCRCCHCCCCRCCCCCCYRCCCCCCGCCRVCSSSSCSSSCGSRLTAVAAVVGDVSEGSPQNQRNSTRRRCRSLRSQSNASTANNNHHNNNDRTNNNNNNNNRSNNNNIRHRVLVEVFVYRRIRARAAA